jgi:hypothetical protein
MFVIVLAILVLVVGVVSAPLRRGSRHRGPGGRRAAAAGAIADLEAARDAKYREIRDAELDHETGKLSDEDFGATDQALRAEAIEILHQLDGVQGR